LKWSDLNRKINDETLTCEKKLNSIWSVLRCCSPIQNADLVEIKREFWVSEQCWSILECGSVVVVRLLRILEDRIISPLPQCIATTKCLQENLIWSPRWTYRNDDKNSLKKPITFPPNPSDGTLNSKWSISADFEKTSESHRTWDTNPRWKPHIKTCCSVRYWLLIHQLQHCKSFAPRRSMYFDSILEGLLSSCGLLRIFSLLFSRTSPLLVFAVIDPSQRPRKQLRDRRDSPFVTSWTCRENGSIGSQWSEGFRVFFW
jgi:hypothetical protein